MSNEKNGKRLHMRDHSDRYREHHHDMSCLVVCQDIGIVINRDPWVALELGKDHRFIEIRFKVGLKKGDVAEKRVAARLVQNWCEYVLVHGEPMREAEFHISPTDGAIQLLSTSCLQLVEDIVVTLLLPGNRWRIDSEDDPNEEPVLTFLGGSVLDFADGKSRSKWMETVTQGTAAELSRGEQQPAEQGKSPRKRKKDA